MADKSIFEGFIGKIAEDTKIFSHQTRPGMGNPSTISDITSTLGRSMEYDLDVISNVNDGLKTLLETEVNNITLSTENTGMAVEAMNEVFQQLNTLHTALYELISVTSQMVDSVYQDASILESSGTNA